MGKKVIYLVGAIEVARNQGKAWREQITPKLQALGYKVLDPCLLENEQINIWHELKFPKVLKSSTGQSIIAKSWHDLYYASPESKARKLFDKCMYSVMDYDIEIVQKRCDYILCFWNKACERSVGSHGELTLAYVHKIPIVLVHATSTPLPRWAYCCVKRHGGKIVRTFEKALNILKKWSK